MTLSQSMKGPTSGPVDLSSVPLNTLMFDVQVLIKDELFLDMSIANIHEGHI